MGGREFDPGTGETQSRRVPCNNLEMKVIAGAFALRNISASEVQVYAESQYIYRCEIPLFSSSLFSRFSWSALFFGWSFSMLHFEGENSFKIVGLV